MVIQKLNAEKVVWCWTLSGLDRYMESVVVQHIMSVY